MTSQRTSAHDLCRVVTKISSCWVFAIIRQGIEQLEMCFTFIFLLFPEKWMGRGMLILAGGGGGTTPAPAPALCHTPVRLSCFCMSWLERHFECC